MKLSRLMNSSYRGERTTYTKICGETESQLTGKMVASSPASSDPTNFTRWLTGLLIRQLCAFAIVYLIVWQQPGWGMSNAVHGVTASNADHVPKLDSEGDCLSRASYELSSSSDIRFATYAQIVLPAWPCWY